MVLACDVSSLESFENMKGIFEDVRNLKTMPMSLVANKVDLGKYEVTKPMLEDFWLS
jgi:hypothetical protein